MFPFVTDGYGVVAVDDLLSPLAAELDAGRPVAPLIENAVFRLQSWGYPLDSVEWFLAEVIRRAGCGEPAGTRDDP